MDESEESGLASARGILRCLHMLGEEARGAGLGRTAQAIAEAVVAAQVDVARFGCLVSHPSLPRTLN